MPPDSGSRNSAAVSTRVAYAIMAATVFIFASAFVGIRFMLDRMDVMTFTALRLTIASGGFLVGGLIARVGLPRRRDLRRVAVAGLCGFTLYHVCLNVGALRISAGQTAFMTSTIPIWTAFAASRTLGETVSRRHWVGLLVSLLGIAVMSLDPSAIDLGLGALAVVVAAMFASANIVLQKGLLDDYRPFDLTVHVALLGSLPMVLWLPGRVDELAALGATEWAVVTYLGLGPIVLGYWLSTVALKALPAFRTSQFLLLISPLAATLAWLILGEIPALRTLAGGIVVLIGVAMTLQRRRAKSLRPPT